MKEFFKTMWIIFYMVVIVTIFLLLMYYLGKGYLTALLYVVCVIVWSLIWGYVFNLIRNK